MSEDGGAELREDARADSEPRPESRSRPTSRGGCWSPRWAACSVSSPNTDPARPCARRREPGERPRRWHRRPSRRARWRRSTQNGPWLRKASGLAVDAAHHVYVSDDSAVYVIDNAGTSSPYLTLAELASTAGLASAQTIFDIDVGPDGKLYVSALERASRRRDPHGHDRDVQCGAPGDAPGRSGAFYPGTDGGHWRGQRRLLHPQRVLERDRRRNAERLHRRRAGLGHRILRDWRRPDQRVRDRRVSPVLRLAPDPGSGRSRAGPSRRCTSPSTRGQPVRRAFRVWRE